MTTKLRKFRKGMMEWLENQRIKEIQEKTGKLRKLRQFKEQFGSWWNDRDSRKEKEVKLRCHGI